MLGQRIVVPRVGGPEVLQSVDVELGAPGPGEVLLEQTAMGVNYIDTYHRSGLYTLPTLPHGIGMEAVGIVRQVGSQVNDVQLGQRVGYVSGAPGAYATQRVVPAQHCVPLPDTVSDEVAARSMLKGFTVYNLIHKVYAVQPGQWVLLHAAAGGVGVLASQWLRQRGARVIGTVSTDEKAQLARDNGCEFAVVYTRESFAQRVREITAGALVSVVFDSVGKSTLLDSLTCLAPRGMLVSFGNASGKPPAVELSQLAERSLFVTRPRLMDYTATRAELLESAKALFDALAAGLLTPTAGPSFALRDAAAAHTALESRSTTGSLLLLP